MAHNVSVSTGCPGWRPEASVACTDQDDNTQSGGSHTAPPSAFGGRVHGKYHFRLFFFERMKRIDYFWAAGSPIPNYPKPVKNPTQIARFQVPPNLMNTKVTIWMVRTEDDR